MKRVQYIKQAIADTAEDNPDLALRVLAEAGVGREGVLEVGGAPLVLDLAPGYYLGLFTSAVIGMFQALVHTIGYLRRGGQARGLGAGFYSSIPLAGAGLFVFIQIIRILVAL